MKANYPSHDYNCRVRYRKRYLAVGLDPAIGFLHELDESKEPLVYDVQELFRWLIDLLLIQLLKEKKLKKSDFIVT